MRNQFDLQLQQLHRELIKMGALCEEAISAGVKALLDSDRAMAEKAMQRERDIDQKERDIERLCMKLLLQQQPVARDLRTISSALKMISDMERIGDQAADIAEIARDMKDSRPAASSVPSGGHGQGGRQHGDRQRGLLCQAGPGAGPPGDRLGRQWWTTCSSKSRAELIRPHPGRQGRGGEAVPGPA